MARVTLNGVDLVSSKEAARLVGYSSDYVSRLAREQRVVGMQVKRQWYVDLTSLHNALAHIALEKEVRSRRLQEERRQEREAVQLASELHVVSTTPQASARFVWRQVWVSGGIVLSGLCAGVLLWSAVTQTDGALQFANVKEGRVLASAAAEPVAPSAPVQESESSTPVFEYIEPDFKTTAERMQQLARLGVLLLGDEQASSTYAYITSLFSDEVSLELQTGDRYGTVTPQFRDGLGSSTRFLLVPVNHVNE